jgi:cell wall-associated NlpC family hydrolase
MITRQQVVAEARKWLGTPFCDKGRLRGIGVDCVGLVLCVMRDLKLHDWVDEFKVYSAQPVGRMVFEVCAGRLNAKPLASRLPGDVLVFRVPVAPVHVGIVTDVGIIHAYNSGKFPKVVEHVLDVNWLRRVEGCFSIPGVE